MTREEAIHLARDLHSQDVVYLDGAHQSGEEAMETWYQAGRNGGDGDLVEAIGAHRGAMVEAYQDCLGEEGEPR